ncbi:WAS/WASL-interacting protein family member 3-like [Oryza brachyantha]|uniref:WAS/WASL-interacting protein family member 3-like n=1 Tax=Oryza brachyantha TaxID=4533 RepID=UPI001ADC1C6F|nr:WAS/WASL-interacting protein family member 3-like [Oryza brachyantha]
MATAAVKSPEPPFAFHHAPLPPLLDCGEEDDEFEFSIPAAAAVLSAADELFSGGKLVPLLPPPLPRASPPCSPPACLEVPSEPASPRAPRCSGHRWRDLLLLVSAKKTSAGDGERKGRMGEDLRRGEAFVQPLLSRASSSSSSASSCDSGRNARRPPQPSSRSPLRTRSAPVASLLHLMSKRQTGDSKRGAPAADAPLSRREPQHAAHPFLTRVSSSSSASSSDSSSRNSRSPWHPPGPARPPPAVAAESPRVSASGRVLFRGLERCSSSPATAGIGPRRPRPRGMERSFSANVRVDPVINVFGFGHLFLPSSPAKDKKTDKDRDIAGGRRNRPAKLAMVLRDPQD